MREISLRIGAVLLGSYCALSYAQPVPKLVRFSGSYRPASGTPAQTMESVTLSVYRDQTGGDAVWHEIQNVVVDADGHYSVLMGATLNQGMPVDLFASGEPRWLGVQFNRPGEPEQARVLLVSVPYALKAADAETLGGKPASAYLLATPTVGADSVTRESATTVVKPKATPANSGLPNYIGKFVNATDLVDSAMYEVNGNVGIFTTTPAISLDVRTGTLPQMGIAGTADYLTFFASDKYGPAIYWDPAKDMRFGKGGTGLYNPFGFVEQMRIQSSTGNVGIGTMTPGSKLDVAGDINFTGNFRYRGFSMLQIPADLTSIGLGFVALVSNTSGKFNTATGTMALAFNTTASGNTATGSNALSNNTTGNGNTAVGASALLSNNNGSNNTAYGAQAMQGNIFGIDNTALGALALYSNTTGNNNIAVGSRAAQNVAGGSNNIHIGTAGSSGDNNTIQIGTLGTQTSFFAAGIRGITTANNDAIPVVIDSNGQLGTVSSSRRFKEDISDMGDASRDLMRLRPVTYRYKEPFADGSKPIQYGLIAEEVAEVYPDLVAHSADGKIETVKYQVLDSMLLNEVQRQQDHIKHLEQQNQTLQERLTRMEAALASMSTRRSQ